MTYVPNRALVRRAVRRGGDSYPAKQERTRRVMKALQISVVTRAAIFEALEMDSLRAAIKRWSL